MRARTGPRLRRGAASPPPTRRHRLARGVLRAAGLAGATVGADSGLVVDTNGSIGQGGASTTRANALVGSMRPPVNPFGRDRVGALGRPSRTGGAPNASPGETCGAGVSQPPRGASAITPASTWAKPGPNAREPALAAKSIRSSTPSRLTSYWTADRQQRRQRRRSWSDRADRGRGARCPARRKDRRVNCRGATPWPPGV
jgi:hypothetical protein